MNARVVIRVNAAVVLTLGVALAIPLSFSWLYGDGSWANFFFPSAAMILAGAGDNGDTNVLGTGLEVRVEQGHLPLRTLAWVLAAVLGGTTFLMEGTFVSP